MPLPSRGEGILGGRYRLGEPIGRGGTSVVWRAHDRVLDRDVAVKIVNDGGELFRERLRGEATTAGRLRDPRIAHIYDYGEIDSGTGGTTPYLVMELIDGQPLTGMLTDGGRLPWREAVAIAGEVAAALATAHADGLAHRDVKPDNVLLTSDGVKLIDFGISAAVGSDDTEPDGRILGTIAYVAPERLVGAPVGPAADVYALGVLIYRMIAGELPWSYADRQELLHAHLNLDPAPLPLAAGVPLELAELYTECLRKDPSRRPTAAQLAAMLPPLTAHAHGVPVDGPTTDLAVVPPAAGRRRARRVVAALATAAICLTVATLVWRGGGTPTRAVAGSVPTTAPCAATFSVGRDWGSGFTATLTVVNTDQTVHGWRIVFHFTGGQRLTIAARGTVTEVDQPGHSATLRQAGTTVTAADPGQTVGTGESITLRLSGRYTGTNPIPLDFRLNGRPCAAQVTGAAGRPPTTGGGSPTTEGGGPHGGGTPATPPGAPAPGTGAPGTTAPGTTAPTTTAPGSPAPGTTPPTTGGSPSPSATGDDGKSKPPKSPKPHRSSRQAAVPGAAQLRGSQPAAGDPRHRSRAGRASAAGDCYWSAVRHLRPDLGR